MVLNDIDVAHAPLPWLAHHGLEGGARLFAALTSAWEILLRLAHSALSRAGLALGAEHLLLQEATGCAAMHDGQNKAWGLDSDLRARRRFIARQLAFAFPPSRVPLSDLPALSRVASRLHEASASWHLLASAAFDHDKV